jgi:TolB-like protein
MIWTDSYDRDLTDIFAVQSEIAQLVAAKLNARFNADHTKAQRQKGE